jgi:hypothetical protein
MEKRNFHEYFKGANPLGTKNTVLKWSNREEKYSSERKDKEKVLYDVWIRFPATLYSLVTCTTIHERGVMNNFYFVINFLYFLKKTNVVAFVEDLTSTDVGPLCSAIDLLEKMLELDADKRITAEQILAHPYLVQVLYLHTVFRRLISFCRTMLGYAAVFLTHMVCTQWAEGRIEKYPNSGRWVAKLGRWVDKLGRWLAKLVARLLATAVLWVRIQTTLKNIYKIWAT